MPSWWDRFGQEWANNGLTDDPTNAQADAGWAFIGQAPPTVEQFNSMFQWSDDKDNWLYGQIANCIISGGMTPNNNDLTQLWNAIKSLQKTKLTQDTAFYVDAINGSDATGTGISDSPWKTIQHALNFLYTSIDLAGRKAIVQLAPGTYTEFTHNQAVNGQIIIQGDRLNPRNYIIKTTSPNGAAIFVDSGAALFIQGFSLEASGSSTGGVYSSDPRGILCSGGTIYYDCIAFGPCVGFHAVSSRGGMIYPMNNQSTTYSIYGAAKFHAMVDTGGYFGNAGLTITITNTPAFQNFYWASGHGEILCHQAIYSGSATGPRYLVNSGGILYTQGNPNNIPGNAAGTVDAATYGILI